MNQSITSNNKKKGPPKGQSNNPNGRPKGSSNKDRAIKERHIYEALIGSLKTGSFYVYCHYNILTGEIFYIGKGVNNRAWQRGELIRNYKWAEYIRNIGNRYDVRIIAANLSEKEALAIEAALIKANNPVCNIAQAVFAFNPS